MDTNGKKQQEPLSLAETHDREAGRVIHELGLVKCWECDEFMLPIHRQGAPVGRVWVFVCWECEKLGASMGIL
jgi:hypothetical protein